MNCTAVSHHESLRILIVYYFGNLCERCENTSITSKGLKVHIDYEYMNKGVLPVSQLARMKMKKKVTMRSKIYYSACYVGSFALLIIYVYFLPSIKSVILMIRRQKRGQGKLNQYFKHLNQPSSVRAFP